MTLRKITHPKGWHTHWPQILPRVYFGRKHLYVDFQFDTMGSHYVLPGEEQGDWNKVIGLDYSPFTPGNKGLAVMLAWRKYGGAYQVGIYTHDAAGGRSVPEENGTLMFVGTDLRRMLIEWYPNRWVLTDMHTGKWKSTQGPATLPCFSRLIRPWFGGDNVAPVKICYELAWQ